MVSWGGASYRRHDGLWRVDVKCLGWNRVDTMEAAGRRGDWRRVCRETEDDDCLVVGAVSSWKFGDAGSYSLRDAKGLASGKHPGPPVLLGATTWPDPTALGAICSTTKEALVCRARSQTEKA